MYKSIISACLLHQYKFIFTLGQVFGLHSYLGSRLGILHMICCCIHLYLLYKYLYSYKIHFSCWAMYSISGIWWFCGRLILKIRVKESSKREKLWAKGCAKQKMPQNFGAKRKQKHANTIALMCFKCKYKLLQNTIPYYWIYSFAFLFGYS